MRALNAEAKLFFPGRGLVTPERERSRRGKAPLDRSTNPFVSKDEDVPFVGDDDDACVATTPREGDESPLSLFGDDEASALELDASTLSPATATAETETEWVRFDGDDGEDDDDARRAMEASDASLTRPLLRSSSSSGYVEAYGASAAGSVQFTILPLFVLLGGSATRGDGESERRSEGRALPWGWPRAEVAI